MAAIAGRHATRTPATPVASRFEHRPPNGRPAGTLTPVNINNIGLTTDFGKRVAWAVQNYGMYVVDELYGSWDPIAMAVEYGVNEALDARYGSSLEGGAIARTWRRIYAQLSVITNNSSTSVGGGGTPRQPLAPPIGN